MSEQSTEWGERRRRREAERLRALAEASASAPVPPADGSAGDARGAAEPAATASPQAPTHRAGTPQAAPP
ncbi:hypothetical protein, partial [Cellulomonas carbonis]